MSCPKSIISIHENKHNHKRVNVRYFLTTWIRKNRNEDNMMKPNAKRTGQNKARGIKMDKRRIIVYKQSILEEELKTYRTKHINIEVPQGKFLPAQRLYSFGNCNKLAASATGEARADTRMEPVRKK